MPEVLVTAAVFAVIGGALRLRSSIRQREAELLAAGEARAANRNAYTYVTPWNDVATSTVIGAAQGAIVGLVGSLFFVYALILLGVLD